MRRGGNYGTGAAHHGLQRDRLRGDTREMHGRCAGVVTRGGNEVVISGGNEVVTTYCSSILAMRCLLGELLARLTE